MADRVLKNSKINAEKVDGDEAYLRIAARAEDLDRDLKVNQIHDQPGTGRRPARRTRNRTRNY